MRFRSLSVAVLGASLLAGTATCEAWSPFGINGNDTGGIIPWSPENEARAFEIASAQCARWNKYPLATSIFRMPGSYIGYRCVWDQPSVVARRRDRVHVIIDK